MNWLPHMGLMRSNISYQWLTVCKKVYRMKCLQEKCNSRGIVSVHYNTHLVVHMNYYVMHSSVAQQHGDETQVVHSLPSTTSKHNI